MEKIDQVKLPSLKSNPDWKLQVDFEQYFLAYEDKINKLIKDVKLRE